MKLLAILCPMFALILASAAAAAVGGEKPSMERGKELFSSPKLGSNGNSCADCHPGGRKLGRVNGYNDEDLVSIINRCIQKPLAGKPLDPSSTEMKSLILYIRSLGEQPDGGRK